MKTLTYALLFAFVFAGMACSRDQGKEGQVNEKVEKLRVEMQERANRGAEKSASTYKGIDQKIEQANKRREQSQQQLNEIKPVIPDTNRALTAEGGQPVTQPKAAAPGGAPVVPKAAPIPIQKSIPGSQEGMPDPEPQEAMDNPNPAGMD